MKKVIFGRKLIKMCFHTKIGKKNTTIELSSQKCLKWFQFITHEIVAMPSITQIHAIFQVETKVRNSVCSECQFIDSVVKMFKGSSNLNLTSNHFRF